MSRVSFVAVPVRLELDALQTSDGKQLELARGSNGEISVGCVPGPRLTARGRIVWNDPNDQSLKAADQSVRVYVNGFQQRPAELQQPATGGKSERVFETEILLNRDVENRIEFEVPGLRWDAGSRPQVLVQECTGFTSNQWLHLLIIGAGEENGKTLLDSLLKAMNARWEKDHWRTDVFERVEKYGPLTVADDNLTPQAVQWQLGHIRDIMRGRQAAGAGDVVWIYFKGGERIDEKGHFLLTGGPDRAGGALPSADLARFFTSSRGAQLLFLDVVRATEAKGKDQLKDDWQIDAQMRRVGVFRAGFPTNGAQPPRGVEPLDKALQEEMPKATKLAQVEKGLSQKYGALEPLSPIPYFYVYKYLDEMRINPQKEKR